MAAPWAALAEPEAWRLVEYRGPIPAEERALLEDMATLIADPMPPFGYHAKLSAHAVAALEARPAVASISDVPRSSKASRDIEAGTQDVRVLLWPDADARSFASQLLVAGASAARVTPTTEPMVDARLGGVAISWLLDHPATRWVEPLRAKAELDNDRASSIVQSGTNAAWPLHDHGVNGSSQVVSYCDTGLDTDAPAKLLLGHTVHEEFADPSSLLVHNVPSSLHRKVALYYSPIDAGGLRGDFDDSDAHGTHVAGTLAGDAGAWGARDGHDGVAFAARLAVCDVANDRGFQLLSDYSGYWQPAYDAGARVNSNSWGTQPSDEYSLVARQHDAYAWEHRDFLILRSMGNSGPDGLMRPEAVAKNVLAIGATLNQAAGGVWEFSGRGPAGDGRIKPDLVAPGACVMSASIASPTAYVCWNGTSMATPVVAGAATLVRDYFAKGFYPSGAATPADAREPSSALVRAILVASALPVAAASPDGDEGWGRPQLDTALTFEGGPVSLDVHDEDIALDTGSTWSTTLDASEGESFHIVLVWTDYPAPPGASSALVNDLDLEVMTPSGAILHGNADLAAPDRTNVIERVLVAGAEAGTYTLRVRGWNVPVGPQPFALVVLS